MFSNYDPKRYNPTAGIEIPPPGRYEASIEEASNTYSKAGSAMIKVVFLLTGKNTKVYYYFADGEYIQRRLDQFFDCFGLRPGDFELQNWLGRTGDVQIVHEDYNGRKNVKIHYFHLRKIASVQSPNEESHAPFLNEPKDEVFQATDDDIPF